MQENLWRQHGAEAIEKREFDIQVINVWLWADQQYSATIEWRESLFCWLQQMDKGGEMGAYLRTNPFNSWWDHSLPVDEWATHRISWNGKVWNGLRHNTSSMPWSAAIL
jgi:hypothetical protein